MTTLESWTVLGLTFATGLVAGGALTVFDFGVNAGPGRGITAAAVFLWQRGRA